MLNVHDEPSLQKESTLLSPNTTPDGDEASPHKKAPLVKPNGTPKRNESSYLKKAPPTKLHEKHAKEKPGRTTAYVATLKETPTLEEWADVAGRAMKSHITTTAAAAAAGLLIRAVVRVGGSGSSGSGRSQILAARAIMLVLLLRMVSALRRATLGAPQNRLRSYVERHCVSFDPSRANRSRRSSKGEIALSTITEEECCHR